MPFENPLFVNEIFFSIQGESTFAGLPCLFIRLTGCNLRCSYCDTPYAFEEGKPLTIQDVLTQARSFGNGLVEVTGGEPLLQPSCLLLIQRLLNQGYTVLVETNGSRDIRCLPKNAICILDMKCPSSGMTDRMVFENLQHLRPQDELKFVIRDREDFRWAKELLAGLSKLRPHKVLFSPAHPLLDAPQLAEWILADKLRVRLQVPLHRVLWPEADRGR